jgi:cell division septation protein DedD
MNYEFALDKKALISLIAGSVLIGVLLFLAGWIVGRQWTVSAAETASTTAEDERAALPKEPVLPEEPSAPNVETPKSTNPKLTVPKEAVETPTQPSAAAAPSQLAAATAQPAGDVRIIESTGDAAATDEKAAAEPEYVTVQVGVFLDHNEASQLLQRIEKKGYAPTFFSSRDAEARQWYAVRIGVYSDKHQAANAAANFTKQEKMKAVVRPLESL